MGSPNTVISGAPVGSEEDLKELNNETIVEEPEVKAPEKEEKLPEKEEETLDELPEKTDEEDKVDEDELPELITGRPRPAYKDITAKYPELFKEFPDLKEMFFREAKYTELFPTVDDAKNAAGAAENYKYMENLILSGTPEGNKEFLEIVKETNADSYKSYVANFLPTLQATDKDLYFAVTLPILDNVIKTAYREGESSGNENLKGAAWWISKYLFGDPGYAKGEKKFEGLKIEPKKTDPEREKFEKEKQEYYSSRAREFESSVVDESESRFREFITEELDPNNEFTDFTREHMIDKIKDLIGSTLEKDEYHMTRMNALWKQAATSGFSKQSKDRLVSAFLSRAKTLLPDARRKVRAMAKGRPSPEEVEKRTSRKEVVGNRAPSRSSSVGKVDYKSLSDRDILDGKS